MIATNFNIPEPNNILYSLYFSHKMPINTILLWLSIVCYRTHSLHQCLESVCEVSSRVPTGTVLKGNRCAMASSTVRMRATRDHSAVSRPLWPYLVMGGYCDQVHTNWPYFQPFPPILFYCMSDVDLNVYLYSEFGRRENWGPLLQCTLRLSDSINSSIIWYNPTTYHNSDSNFHCIAILTWLNCGCTITSVNWDGDSSTIAQH